MRFAIVAEQRYLAQRMPGDLVAALTASGHSADVICSDDAICDFRSRAPRFDIYDAVISRDRSLVGLFLLACAERAGVPTVNCRSAVEGVRNKAEMTATLAASGIPMPETVVCRSLDQLRQLPASFFPFVLKPNFGDNGLGIVLVSLSDLHGLRPSDASVLLAQKFVPNDGFDLKLYVAGDHVWAVRKPNLWSSSKSGAVAAVPVDSEMRSLALRCGAALGLEVYGVDTLPGSERLLVLEVNEFPNFSGIAEAPQVVADLLIKKARDRAGDVASTNHNQRRPRRVA